MFKKWFGKDVDKEVKKIEIEHIDVRKVLNKMKKEMRNKSITPAPSPVSIAGNGSISTTGSILSTGYGLSYPSTWSATSSSYVTTGQSASSSSYTVGSNLHNMSSIITFNKAGGAEVVRLNSDGTIKWANGIEIDEAAKAFARSVQLGAEMSAGITKGAKLRMRDSVFADLINIAKEKGSLTADDLTYLLEASKIVEKLKGNFE
jgi:hypothetical protein